MSKAPQTFYRYVSTVYGSVDEFDNPTRSWPKLECHDYFLVSETPQGYWIGICPEQKYKWVSKTSRKRFAYPTKEEALNSYIIRTTRRIEILQAHIRDAEMGLSAAKRLAETGSERISFEAVTA